MNPNLEQFANPDFRRKEVETLAYFLWKNAGEPTGTAERDWLLAEHAIESGPLRTPDWSDCQN
jgi:hypothetical protein